jgi:hypothetical protein
MIQHDTSDEIRNKLRAVQNDIQTLLLNVDHLKSPSRLAAVNGFEL